MAATQVFKVLTEFRFEAGSAIASSNQLTSAVDGVSNAADQALISFQRLSLGILTNFLSGPGGGVLGALGSAVSVSDEFRKNQIALAAIAGKGSGIFSDRMFFAAEQMERINHLAKSFSLPGEDLLAITKTLAPVLKPEFGLEKGFDKSIDIGRFFLKSAPVLGIDPGESLFQLQRAMLGAASMGDTLFRVLVNDTKAMREFVGKSAQFNKLPITERVDKLLTALKQFGNDASAVEATVNTVSAQFRILKESFIGVFSILKPLGDVLSVIVIDFLKKVNAFIGTTGTKIFKNLAEAIEPFAKNSESLLATFLQLRELKSDVKLAGSVLLFTTGLLGLNWVLGMLGVKILFVSGLLGGFAKFIGLLEAPLALFGASKFPLFLTFMDGFLLLVSRILAPLGLLVLLFQIISRAVAIAKIDGAKKIAEFVESISEVGRNFSRLMAIFLEGVDTIAKFIAPVFQNFFIRILGESAGILDGMVKSLVLVVAGFQGLAFAILEFVNQIKNAALGQGFDSGAIGKSFNAGQQDIFDKVFGKIQDGSAIVQQNVDMKVTMNNSFKETVQPDRIAFTVRDQLLKAAQNKTGSRSLSLPGTGR